MAYTKNEKIRPCPLCGSRPRRIRKHRALVCCSNIDCELYHFPERHWKIFNNFHANKKIEGLANEVMTLAALYTSADIARHKLVEDYSELETIAAKRRELYRNEVKAHKKTQAENTRLKRALAKHTRGQY